MGKLNVEKRTETKYKFDEDTIQDALVLYLKVQYDIQIDTKDNIDFSFYEDLEYENDAMCEGAILKITSENKLGDN